MCEQSAVAHGTLAQTGAWSRRVRERELALLCYVTTRTPNQVKVILYTLNTRRRTGRPNISAAVAPAPINVGTT